MKEVLKSAIPIVVSIGIAYAGIKNGHEEAQDIKIEENQKRSIINSETMVFVNEKIAQTVEDIRTVQTEQKKLTKEALEIRKKQYKFEVEQSAKMYVLMNNLNTMINRISKEKRNGGNIN